MIQHLTPIFVSLSTRYREGLEHKRSSKVRAGNGATVLCSVQSESRGDKGLSKPSGLCSYSHDKGMKSVEDTAPRQEIGAVALFSGRAAAELSGTVLSLS